MNDDKKLANIISENLLKNLSTELLLKKDNNNSEAL